MLLSSYMYGRVLIKIDSLLISKESSHAVLSVWLLSYCIPTRSVNMRKPLEDWPRKWVSPTSPCPLVLCQWCVLYLVDTQVNQLSVGCSSLLMIFAGNEFFNVEGCLVLTFFTVIAMLFKACDCL